MKLKRPTRLPYSRPPAFQSRLPTFKSDVWELPASGQSKEEIMFFISFIDKFIFKSVDIPAAELKTGQMTVIYKLVFLLYTILCAIGVVRNK